MTEETYQKILKAGLLERTELPELGAWWRATSLQEYKTLEKRLLRQAYRMYEESQDGSLDILVGELREATFEAVAKDPTKSRQWLNECASSKDESNAADILRRVTDPELLEQAHRTWKSERISYLLAGNPYSSRALITSLTYLLNPTSSLGSGKVLQNIRTHLNAKMSYRVLRRNRLLRVMSEELKNVDEQTLEALGSNWEGSLEDLIEAVKELS